MRSVRTEAKVRGSEPIVAVGPNEYLDARVLNPAKCLVMEQAGVVRFAKQTGVVYLHRSFAEHLGIAARDAVVKLERGGGPPPSDER